MIFTKAVYLFFPKVFTERTKANRERVVGNKSSTISDQTAWTDSLSQQNPQEANTCFQSILCFYAFKPSSYRPNWEKSIFWKSIHSGNIRLLLVSASLHPCVHGTSQAPFQHCFQSVSSKFALKGCFILTHFFKQKFITSDLLRVDRLRSSICILQRYNSINTSCLLYIEAEHFQWQDIRGDPCVGRRKGSRLRE